MMNYSILSDLKPNPRKASPRAFILAAETLSEEDFRAIPYNIYDLERDPETGMPKEIPSFQDLMKCLNMDQLVNMAWILAKLEDPKITKKKVKEGIHTGNLFTITRKVFEAFTVTVVATEMIVSDEEEESGTVKNE